MFWRTGKRVLYYRIWRRIWSCLFQLFCFVFGLLVIFILYYLKCKYNL